MLKFQSTLWCII